MPYGQIFEERNTFSLPDFVAERYAVICDFDGTVTPCDVTDAILEAFAPPQWKDIERDWVNGHITARACMGRQIPLIDASLDQLDAFLEGIPVTDGFVAFARFCQTGNIPLTIVSDGMDYPIRSILRRHGLVHIPVIANRLLYREQSGYRLEFPYGREECPSGVCKCAVAEVVVAARKALLIGDGLSDCCLAKTAAFTLARYGKTLHQKCITQGYPHQTYADFFDVLDAFETSFRARRVPVVREVPAA